MMIEEWRLEKIRKSLGMSREEFDMLINQLKENLGITEENSEFLDEIIKNII